MFILALISLSFSGWMAWTLYSDKRELGYIGTAWIAGGSLAGIVTAIRAVL